MAVLTKPQLVAKWIAGFRPSNSDYSNFFDSFFHKLDTIPSDVLYYENIASLPATGAVNKLYFIADVDGDDTRGIRVWYENSYQDPVAAAAADGYTTPAQVRDALTTLTGTNRLSATAIKDLPGSLTDAEIETAYNNQVPIVSQAEAEAGTVTAARRWTPARVKQAIEALATSVGGKPSRVTLTGATGIVATVSYWGVSAPTISGSAGNYNINCPASSVLNSATLIAAVSSQATNSNQIAVTFTDIDGNNYFSTAQPTATDNNGQKLVDLQAIGIEHRETSASAGSVTNTFIEIGAQTSSFRITFTF